MRWPTITPAKGILLNRKKSDEQVRLLVSAPTQLVESEDLELKSDFDGSDRQWFEIVRTITAMANTKGGRLILQKSQCDPALLDSARLTDRVNKALRPRLASITSRVTEAGVWEITVQPSRQKPHVFVTELNYLDGGKNRSAFYPGQVYARHSSKTEPATEEDFARMIQESVANWLEKLAKGIHELSFQITADPESLPVRFAHEPAALSVTIRDPNTDFPYTTKSLGVCIGKSQNWTARAVRKLGLINNPSYSIMIDLGSYKVAKYNDAAVQTLRQRLRDEPNFDPYH
jgi:hypothetical protein